MNVLLLAAGMGLRVQRPHPKILLDYGGITLLERHLRILAAQTIQPIRHVVIVCGFQATDIIRAIDALAPQLPSLHIQTTHNEEYAKGSIVSLERGINTMMNHQQEKDAMLLMDGDVLYDGRLIHRLTSSPHQGCLLMDRHGATGDEPVKIALHKGQIVDIAKHVNAPHYDTIGESVGFFKFNHTLIHALREKTHVLMDISAKQAPHEDAIRSLVLDTQYRPYIGVEDITDIPWMEIDFPHDIEKAHKDIFPHLQELPS